MKRCEKVHNMTELTMAMARAYCHKKNEKKTLDANLINIMAREVMKILPRLYIDKK